MPNRPFAFALFLSSYAPAFLILAVRAVNRSCVMVAVSLSLAALSIAALLLFVYVIRKGAPYRATLEDVEPRDAEIAAYVATYLLPFLTVFGATAQDVVALALFLFFIGVLWVNSGLIYLNPVLALGGYHVYVVRARAVGANPADTLVRSFLLSKERDLRTGERVLVSPVSTGVLIDLTERNGTTS